MHHWLVLIGPINCKISSWWSSSCCAFEQLVKSVTDFAIGITNAWRMYVLWLFVRMSTAKKCIAMSKFERLVDKNILVQDWRRFQYSKVGVALWIFFNSYRKWSWVESMPLRWNIVFKMMIVVKYFNEHFPGVAPAYRGLSIKAGIWPKSLTRMIEWLSNQQLFYYGKHSRKRLPIWTNNLGPMKLISSMRMYWICFISSWNNNRACPCKGLVSFIGIWSWHV